MTDMVTLLKHIPELKKIITDLEKEVKANLWSKLIEKREKDNNYLYHISAFTTTEFPFRKYYDNPMEIQDLPLKTAILIFYMQRDDKPSIDNLGYIDRSDPRVALEITFTSDMVSALHWCEQRFEELKKEWENNL